MHIGVDANCWANRRGYGRYARELLNAVLEQDQAGEYTFYLRTDTGALLRIHDATLIDADFGYSAGQEVSGSIRLQAGLHPFRLYYTRRNKGVPSLDLLWSGLQQPKSSIPAAAFRCQSLQRR